MFFAKTYAAVCGLATLSSAHMIMSSPKPFAGVGQSPLERDGSNFPCQMPSYDSASPNVMAKGSPQELAFIGQAVHGGGSCQVSITYDTAPDKNSVWKVIHSIQGGCPAKNQAGNMGNSASAADPFTYGFTIPDDIPTGNATLAWSWLNRLGNREFYMNCAPISITGGEGETSNYEALPDMVVANIPAITSCSTEGLDGSDYAYPNPGKSVENFNMVALKALPDVCGAKVAGGSGSSDPTTVASAAPVSTSAANVAPPAISISIPGGVFITVKPSSVASSAAAAPTTAEAPSTTAEEAPATTATEAPATEAPATTASVVATTAAAPAATATSSSGSTGSSGSSSGATTAGSACSPEGLWNCVGGSSFQRCGSGTWSPVMALAAGMSCTPGQGATLDMWATNGKIRRRLTRFNAY